MRVSTRAMSGTDVNLAVLRMAARSAVDQHDLAHRAAAGALDAGEEFRLRRPRESAEICAPATSASNLRGSLERGEIIMVSKTALLALALGVSVAIAPGAQAFVAYTVDNPAANFTLFTYDSPGFITTDTVVPVADLAYFAHPPLNFISSVEFIPSSSDPAHLGLPEVECLSI
jgi:hypothetical protein